MASADDGSNPEESIKSRHETVDSPSPAPTDNPNDEIQKRGTKRNLTSKVWEHYKRINVGGEFFAICNYCKAKLKAITTNGTKSLWNHYHKCTGENNNSKTQTIGAAFEKQKQLSFSKRGDRQFTLGNYTFNQDVSRDLLAHMIIKHEYPISIVEHEAFREFVSSLQPLFKMVSRNTIKKDILNIYDIEFQSLKKMFGRLKTRIAITTDMWTSKQKKGYMSITAHYIDDNWILQNRILRFVYVPAPHTKEELARHLLEGLDKWNIQTKISTITVDNCSANDGMVSLLADELCTELVCHGRILHMRCCAHILNLVVKDGLSVIGDALKRIRDSVVFWSASPSRVEKFEAICKQVSVNCDKKLCVDCKTRWNSTYLMLKTAIFYKKIFPKLKLKDKLYTNVPTDDDWILAEKVASRLEIFYNATELFSGRNYPTANCFFITVCQLRNKLFDWQLETDQLITKMAKEMFENFDKYWSDVHVVLSVAIVLDPRYKMKVIEYFYPSLYGEHANVEIEALRRICYNLLDEYQSKAFENSTVSVVPSIPSSRSAKSCSEKTIHDLVAFLNSTSNGVHVKSELDFYLEENVLPWSEEFDILSWWKTNGLKYPTLQRIARDFLAVPISTVASESAFSTGGRVISIHRSRLHEKTVEALMCSQNWIWANSKDSSNCFMPTTLMTPEEEEEEDDSK